MQFDVARASQILERTPGCFQALLYGVSEEWTNANEGEETWNAKDVLAHVIYLDRANWLHRAKLMMMMINESLVHFDPIDRAGGKSLSATMSTSELLNNFHQTRKEALTEIQGLQITPQHYSRTAIHPDFGEVKLSQLLSAWVVHDLSQPVRRSAALLQSSTAKRLAPGFPFYEFSIKAYEKNWLCWRYQLVIYSGLLPARE